MDGVLASAVCEQVVKANWKFDLVAPRLTLNPTVSLQVVGGGGNDVGDGVDHVTPAIAVEIDGVSLERRRHELGRTKRAGPGAAQLLGAQVATLENFESGEKFVAEEGLTTTDAGERRSRSQHWPIADHV